MVNVSSILEQQSAKTLSATGQLAKTLPGYQEREEQQVLAKAIARAITQKTTLVAEAGTGTGKTFAYLIPALLADRQVIISTATKNLQDQLFYRDLPVIRSALSLPKKIALLKGRANYVCLQRLKDHFVDDSLYTQDIIGAWHIVNEWVSYTQEGDIAELSDLPEDAPIWPHVTSNNDNCLGQACEYFKACFFFKAKRAAQEAEVVVINHHLFFADLALREQGFGEVLPISDVVIFDEAHQLASIAGQFLGQTCSSRQLLNLIQDTDIALNEIASDMRTLRLLLQHLQQQVNDLRFDFPIASERAAWHTVARHVPLQNGITALLETWQKVQEELMVAAQRSKTLERCWQRSVLLAESFKQLTGPTPAQQIHWYETFKKSFILHFTPMVIADEFKRYCEQHKRSWVFTSATLSVDHQFTHFTQELGLEPEEQLQLNSPFDYAEQALLYMPRGLCDPRDPAYLDSLLEKAIPLIELCGGRTFFLFTSYRMMQLAYETLQERVTYPLLLQGSQPKRDLLHAFADLGNAVLLGTSSFWQGVDIRGAALSCVIIDKLPFASPGDPIMQARINAMRAQGQDPFNEYQLPQSVIQLKQGVGRLIRDTQDKGILMIADPRLSTRAYGSVFFASLPSMPVTRDWERVQRFFLSSDAVATSI